MQTLKRNKRIFFQLALDIVIISAVYLITNLIINTMPGYVDGVLYDSVTRNAFYITWVSVLVLFTAAYRLFGAYNVLWEISKASDYMRVFLIGIATTIVLGALSYFIEGIFLDARIVMQICIYSASFTTLFRVIYAVVHARPKLLLDESDANLTNLLVIGAGIGGDRVIRELFSTSTAYRIVGVIDDDETKHKSNVQGVPVVGGRDDIIEFCRKNNVDEILFAIPSIDAKEKEKILNICTDTKCKIKVLPNIEEIIDLNNLTKTIRDVNINDLLMRETVSLDVDRISDMIYDKIVMVTGGGGSIGSEICRQVAKNSPAKLIILDIYENNAYDIQNELKNKYPDLDLAVVIASVRDMKRMDEVFAQYMPQIIFHAAAHKHVPLMEENPVEAIKNNVFGTLNTAMCADKYRARKFVLISTDKAVNPTNIMGATKRMCEMLIQAINEKSETDFSAVRFGNVLGSNGSVIPLFQKQIENGGPVTVTHKEITRFFMTIPEAVELVLETMLYAEGGEIFVLDMGKPVRIYDLAKKLIKLSGFEPGRDIEIKITGLRPGEKLYEELLMSEEGLKGTKHEKIYIANPMSFNFDELRLKLENLLYVGETGDIKELKRRIAKVVPTYTYSENEDSGVMMIHGIAENK